MTVYSYAWLLSKASSGHKPLRRQVDSTAQRGTWPRQQLNTPQLIVCYTHFLSVSSKIRQPALLCHVYSPAGGAGRHARAHRPAETGRRPAAAGVTLARTPSPEGGGPAPGWCRRRPPAPPMGRSNGPCRSFASAQRRCISHALSPLTPQTIIRPEHPTLAPPALLAALTVQLRIVHPTSRLRASVPMRLLPPAMLPVFVLNPATVAQFVSPRAA